VVLRNPYQWASKTTHLAGCYLTARIIVVRPFMKAMSAYFLMAAGLTTCVGLEFAGFALAATVEPGEPVLVVAPPWSGGAEAVVAAAGGSIVGPTQAPLSVLATGVSEQAFRDAGAWFLVNPGAVSFFCVTKDTV